MAYDVLESCLLIPDISRTACAAWVQAWGSIAAIGAAISIAWWQRRTERLETALQARVRAEVAGTSILLRLTPLEGTSDAIVRLAEAEADHLQMLAGSFEKMLDALTFPTEEELLAISGHDPLCARMLIRARNVIATLHLQVRLVAARIAEGRPVTAEQMPQVKLGFELVLAQLAQARKRLQELVPGEE